MLLELVLAFAIQETTTTCAPDAAGQVVCRSKGEVRGPDARCAGGDWLLAGCTIGDHREAREARAAQQRATAARERAMSFLRGGDCQGAVNAALDTGDLAFATQVRTFCSTPSPAA